MKKEEEENVYERADYRQLTWRERERERDSNVALWLMSVLSLRTALVSLSTCANEFRTSRQLVTCIISN